MHIYTRALTHTSAHTHAHTHTHKAKLGCRTLRASLASFEHAIWNSSMNLPDTAVRASSGQGRNLYICVCVCVCA